MNEFSRIANRLPDILRSIRFVFAALAAGSRTVPMGDNSGPVADLAERAARLYGECTDAAVPKACTP